MVFNRLKKWVGIPAPDKLIEDKWFPIPDALKEWKDPVSHALETDKVLLEIHGDVNLDEPVSNTEIHEWVYQEATKNSSTTLQINPPGGSEGLHENDDWQSGTGMGQFR